MSVGVGGGDLTGALHVLQLQLSLLPLASSLAAEKSLMDGHSGTGLSLLECECMCMLLVL